MAGNSTRNVGMRRRRHSAWSSLVDLAALEVQEYMGKGGGSLVADDDDSAGYGRFSSSWQTLGDEKLPLLPGEEKGGDSEHFLGNGTESGEHYIGSGMIRTAVTYIKGMVGTYILYLPHLFALGGAASSSIALIILAVLSTIAMLILLDCRTPSIHSYGDVGFAAAGHLGRSAVEFSLVLSQLGFCATYYIFVSKNLGILMGLSPLQSIALQLVVYAPLACIRRLQYLGAGMLIANIFLVIGLFITLWHIVGQFLDEGLHPNVALVNPSKTFMVLGSMLCAFEGIGLVLPIQDAMDEKLKPKFNRLLCVCMVGIATSFLLFALAGYLAFGPEVADFITMELPVDSPEGIIVRLLYSVGIILSFPLQLFPAVKIIERIIWPPLESASMPTFRRRWGKNFLRISICVGVAIAALVGGYAFDVFVALVGALCSVPLALVYPPIFHIRMKKEKLSTLTKVLEYGMAIVGTIGVVLATVTSLASL